MILTWKGVCDHVIRATVDEWHQRFSVYRAHQRVISIHEEMHPPSAASHLSPSSYPPSEPNSPPSMSDHLASSHLKVLFEAALHDYETQTGIALAKHPLAERPQECHSVESITAVLLERTQAFNQFRGKEKVTKLLKNSVSVLYKLSACARLGEVIGVVRLNVLKRVSYV
jgi:hypothetical protein